MDLERLDNIYVIDTMMFGFERYNSAYLVKGKELALIDTCLPTKTDVLISGIKAHGFAVSDISYIFITHCEHRDHSGSVAPILRESPGASVYINPLGLEYLTNPAIEKQQYTEAPAPEFVARQLAGTEPVPPDRIILLKDGDVFDLGENERLRIRECK